LVLVVEWLLAGVIPFFLLSLRLVGAMAAIIHLLLLVLAALVVGDIM
jgi:hypothetical protein